MDNTIFKDLVCNQRYLFHKKDGQKFTADVLSYNSAKNIMKIYLVLNEQHICFNKKGFLENHMFGYISYNNMIDCFKTKKIVNSTVLEELIRPKKNSKFLLIPKVISYYILTFLCNEENFAQHENFLKTINF